MKSSEMDLQIPFLFMLESVAAANVRLVHRRTNVNATNRYILFSRNLLICLAN